MSITFRLVLFLALSLAGASMAATRAQGKVEQDQARGKAAEFAAGQIAALGTAGMAITFEGLMPLPAELDSLARQAFPKHRFAVARFQFMGDLNAYDSHLLIVSDAESGEVVSHIYDPVFGGRVPESFRNFFGAYKPRSRDDVLQSVEVLARLISYPERRAGNASFRKGAVEVAIYWGDRPWRILRTKFGPDRKLSRILFINPSSGKDWDEQAEEMKKEYKTH